MLKQQHTYNHYCTHHQSHSPHTQAHKMLIHIMIICNRCNMQRGVSAKGLGFDVTTHTQCNLEHCGVVFLGCPVCCCVSEYSMKGQISWQGMWCWKENWNSIHTHAYPVNESCHEPAVGCSAAIFSSSLMSFPLAARNHRRCHGGT